MPSLMAIAVADVGRGSSAWSAARVTTTAASRWRKNQNRGLYPELLRNGATHGSWSGTPAWAIFSEAAASGCSVGCCSGALLAATATASPVWSTVGPAGACPAAAGSPSPASGVTAAGLEVRPKWAKRGLMLRPVLPCRRTLAMSARRLSSARSHSSRHTHTSVAMGSNATHSTSATTASAPAGRCAALKHTKYGSETRRRTLMTVRPAA
jgi:hypothetical protein